METDAFETRLAWKIGAGEFLFRAGDAGRHMYVVRHGRVELRQPAAGGTVEVLRSVGPGEVFGEIALIEEVPRTADAIALEDTELLAIDQAHFVYLAGQQPAFAVMMMQLLSQKLRGAARLADDAAASQDIAAGVARHPSGWHKLRDNVYHLSGEVGGGGCKVYLLRGTRRNVLIDAGLPFDYPYLERHLGELGLEPGDIDMVLLTHEHMDHIGSVPYFPSRTLVASHARAANKIESQDDFVIMSDLFGLTPAQFHVDLHVQEDTTIDLGGCALRTICTPGHVSGAVCYYEPEQKLLFTADTLFAGGTLGGIFASGNNSDYVASLRRLASLRIDEMFPGHGRNSNTPHADLELGIRAAERLAIETRTLFDAMRHGNSFDYIFRGVSAYAAHGARRAGLPTPDAPAKPAR